MKVYYLLLICVLVLLVSISQRVNHHGTIFYGIADTKEIIISTDIGVEISRILVVQSQKVAQGDTLAILSSLDLTMHLSDLKHQIDELKSKKAVAINEIKSTLKELNAEFKLNKEIAAELKSLTKNKASTDNGSSNPSALKIQNLEEQLAYEESSKNPIESQIRMLEEESRMITAQQKKLVTIADVDGVIGSIYFKNSERVAPFVPILTIHSPSPNLVNGYIHEKVYNSIAINDTVQVHSLTVDSLYVTGIVVGVGSRMVEYPTRLRKRPDIEIWGREITIRIPVNNTFLLGEKLKIISDADSAESNTSLFQQIKTIFIKHHQSEISTPVSDSILVSSLINNNN